MKRTGKVFRGSNSVNWFMSLSEKESTIKGKKKCSTLKTKEFASLGSKFIAPLGKIFFPFRVDPFAERT